MASDEPTSSSPERRERAARRSTGEREQNRPSEPSGSAPDDDTPTREAELVILGDWLSNKAQRSRQGPGDPDPGDQRPEAEAPGTTRKSPTPAGKIKASFNLLPEDISSLRSMAERSGTTVTYILQRAIRDESFIRDEIDKGNRFAIVDRHGMAREIIWR
jgi:hypothetical protein